MARLNMGEAKDDIHVCILCMRAIMNNKVSLEPDTISSRFNFLPEKKKEQVYFKLSVLIHI